MQCKAVTELCFVLQLMVFGSWRRHNAYSCSSSLKYILIALSSSASPPLLLRCHSFVRLCTLAHIRSLTLSFRQRSIVHARLQHRITDASDPTIPHEDELTKHLHSWHTPCTTPVRLTLHTCTISCPTHTDHNLSGQCNAQQSVHRAITCTCCGTTHTHS